MNTLKLNEVEIIHGDNGDRIILNGQELQCVLEYGIRKNSAQGNTEFILCLDVGDLTITHNKEEDDENKNRVKNNCAGSVKE